MRNGERLWSAATGSYSGTLYRWGGKEMECKMPFLSCTLWGPCFLLPDSVVYIYFWLYSLEMLSIIRGSLCYCWSGIRDLYALWSVGSSERRGRVRRVPQETKKYTWNTAEFEISNNPAAISLFQKFIASTANTLLEKEQAKKALITEIGKLFEREYAQIRSTVNNLLAHRSIFVGSTVANLLAMQPKRAMWVLSWAFV